MILYLYAFKDKKLGAFTQIFTDNLSPDKEKVVIERGLSRFKDIEKLKAYSDVQVYSFGVFNDETGELKATMPDFVIDAGDLVYNLLAAIYARESSEEVKEDESEN